MSIYYQDEHVTLYHGDALDVMESLPIVSAIITDPPYNIGKAAWDSIPDYIDWSAEWVEQATRLLVPGGAFWHFHSEPYVMAQIGALIDEQGPQLVSFITLDKSHWSIAKRYKNAGSKTFPAATEYAALHRVEVYAEQIRQTREDNDMTRAEMDIVMSPSRMPTGITYRWEAGERIPADAEVERFRELFGVKLTRPTFHNPEKWTNVWRFDQPSANGHPTPKPLNLMERCVEATTNHGDVILDPFAGSGTTLLAARNLGRKAIGVELDERYCEIIARRLQQGAFDLGGVA